MAVNVNADCGDGRLLRVVKATLINENGAKRDDVVNPELGQVQKFGRYLARQGAIN